MQNATRYSVANTLFSYFARFQPIKRKDGARAVRRGLVLGLMCLLLFGVSAQAATRIEAWISITNLTITNTPFVNTNSLTWNSSSNRVWTNVVVNPATQIMATNSIVQSRTNLKVQLDTYKFRSWHVISYGTNTNDVIVIAGTNEPISIALSSPWGFVRYVTNTVYISDFVLAPPNGMQSNNFLIWQWTAVATNLEKGTQAISDAVIPFAKYVTTNTAQPLANKKILSSVIFSASVATNRALSFSNRAVISAQKLILDSDGEYYDFSDGAIAENVNTVARLGQLTNRTYQFGTQFHLDTGTTPTSVSLTNLLELGTVTLDDLYLSGIGDGITGLYGRSFDETELFDFFSLAEGKTVETLVRFGEFDTSQFGINYTSIVVKAGSRMTNITGSFSNFTGTVLTSTTNVLQNTIARDNELRGTNTLTGDWAIPHSSYTTIASGNNIAVDLGTNTVVSFDGSISGGVLCGLVAKRSGVGYRIRNNLGAAFTITQNTSDPTAANRFSLYGSADVTVLDRGFVDVRYNTTLARWEVESLYPQATNPPSIAFGQLVSNNDTNTISSVAFFRWTNAATFTLTNNVASANGTNLIPVVAGWYEITSELYGALNNSSTLCTNAVFTNGVACPIISGTFTADSPGGLGYAGFGSTVSGIVYLPAGISVDHRVASVSSSDVFTAVRRRLSIKLLTR